MLMKNLTTAIAAGVMALGVSVSAQAQDVLRIGVEGAYPPFSEKTADGDLIGFDIDIARALCEQMNRECKLVEQDWDGIIPALLAKKYDAIVASMSITPDRQKVVDFTNKYYQTPARFVAEEGVEWEDTPEGLAGKTIGVQRGTIHDDYASTLYTESEIKRYATQDEVYLDLQAGRIDCFLADSVAASNGFLKTEDGADYAFFGKSHTDPEFFGKGAGIAVRPDDDQLKKELNEAIAAIRENGTYDEIADKYFDFDIYGGPPA